MKLKILVLIIGALLLAGCVAKEKDSTSGSFLVINSLVGKDLEGNEDSTTVFSDVITSGGSIYNDNGVATVTAQPFNPDISEVTAYMNIVVDQVDVEFLRTDGRNIEGVDVPYRFVQPVNMLAVIGEDVDIPFILIRHVAKLEPPLLELREWVNQEKVLQLVAKVTFHGKDVGGHRITPVSGYLSVWCSNFADTEGETGE